MLTKEELSKIANFSCLSLSENEEKKFLDDLQKILANIEQLKNIPETEDHFQTNKTMNVFREDKIRPSESEIVMQYAQSTENNQFVVPKVLRKN